MKLINTFITTAFISLALITTAIAEEAEDFKFKDIKGKSHTFSDYKGKWVIVNYWGTYCPPCLEEIPDLVSFAEKHKKDAVVLGFDAGGTTVEDLTVFAKENMMDYIIAPVQESTLTAFGILQGIPTSYVITPEGEEVAKVVGIIDMDEVEIFMQQYANEDTKTKSPVETDQTGSNENNVTVDSVLDL
jgi:thiol-disulfide isomerase/thioredoxin